MGRDGFEPSKQVAADLQSVPFGHSGICPCIQLRYLYSLSYELTLCKTEFVICRINLQLQTRIHYFHEQSPRHASRIRWISHKPATLNSNSPLTRLLRSLRCYNSRFSLHHLISNPTATNKFALWDFHHMDVYVIKKDSHRSAVF